MIGNVALYGGDRRPGLFPRPRRRAVRVRNSGVLAVVEGTGDHGCEYMTGGVVVVIGPTGRNFAAGMSGGVAFVLDESHDFPRRCNLEMVDLEPLAKPEDIELVRDLLTQHAVCTGSTVAMRLLKDWESIGQDVRQGHAARLPARALRAEPGACPPRPTRSRSKSGGKSATRATCARAATPTPSPSGR